MPRRKTLRDQLGFYPFIVTDEDADGVEGATSSEEAVNIASAWRDEYGYGTPVIYQAIKKIEMQPVETEVKGVSF